MEKLKQLAYYTFSRSMYIQLIISLAFTYLMFVNAFTDDRFCSISPKSIRREVKALAFSRVSPLYSVRNSVTLQKAVH